ncbi:MAG TPA: hypothetical protein VGB38_02560 [bacterium]
MTTKRHHNKLTVLIPWFIMGSCVHQAVFGQTGIGGNESLFSIGFSARALGLGNAQAAYPKDPTAFYWNPGAMGVVDQTGMSLSHTLLFENVIYSSVAVVHPTLNTGSFGIGIAAIGIEGIKRTDEVNGVPVSMGEMQYWLGKLTVSYALTLWKGISIGVNFNEHRQVLGSYSTYGFGMDAGIHLGFPRQEGLLKNLFFGISMNNALPAKLKLGTIVETEPYSLRAGFAKAFMFGTSHWLLSADVSGDENLRDENRLKVHAGTEFQWNEILFIRAGMEKNSPVFGGGCRIPNLRFNAVGIQKCDLQLDYAYAQIGDPEMFPKSHRFSLNFYFGHTLPERRRLLAESQRLEVQRKIDEQREADRQKRIREGLQAGRDHLAKEDYFHARLEFSRVLSEDSGNRDAQRFLAETTEKEQNLRLKHESEMLLAAKADEKRRQDLDFVNKRFQDGLDALNRGDYLKAVENWQLALERDSTNTQIRNYIGNTKTFVEREINRLIARSKQLEHQESLTEAYQALVQAKELIGLSPGLRNTVLTETKRLETKIGSVNAFKTGLESYERGDFQAAAQHLERAMQFEPNNVRTAELYRNAKARSLSAGRSTSMPQAAKEKFSSGLKMYQDGRYLDAIRIWEEALVLDPNNVKILDAIQAAKDKLSAFQKSR